MATFFSDRSIKQCFPNAQQKVARAKCFFTKQKKKRADATLRVTHQKNLSICPIPEDSRIKRGRGQTSIVHTRHWASFIRLHTDFPKPSQKEARSTSCRRKNPCDAKYSVPFGYEISSSWQALPACVVTFCCHKYTLDPKKLTFLQAIVALKSGIFNSK